MKNKNEVAVIDSKKVAPFYINGDGVDKMLESIAAEAKALIPDTSTIKGRKEITSNISKYVTAPKTYFEVTGRELSAARKKEPVLIDATRKKVKDFLTKLQIDLRQPLSEWEGEQRAIREAKALDVMMVEASEINVAFDERVEMNYQMNHMQAIIDNSEFNTAKEEKIQEELAAERAIQYEKKERDKRIADEAALKAKLLAEEFAKAESKRLEDEKAAAIQAKADAEAEAKNQREAAIKAEIEIENQKEQARIENENAKALLAKQKAESDRAAKEAAIQADFERKEQANAAEEKRIADIKAVGIEEAKRIKDEQVAELARIETRKRNTAYRTKMKTAMKTSFMNNAGLSEADAISATKAVFAGKIQHAEIKI